MEFPQVIYSMFQRKLHEAWQTRKIESPNHKLLNKKGKLRNCVA